MSNLVDPMTRDNLNTNITAYDRNLTDEYTIEQ